MKIIKWVSATLLLSVLAASCAVPISIVIGSRPDTELLETSLRPGESTREHVWATLGQPYATGRWMMPIDDRARTVWTYYYEDGPLTDARRVLLFVYFDQDRYDGYMWFSSMPK
jgi:hypothetical protein